MPDFTQWQWFAAGLAALGVGVSKSGFAGVSLLHVYIFAQLFGPKQSTGALLPLLIAGDLCAVAAFQQHARWDYIRRMAWPTIVGVILGWLLMGRLSEGAYRPLIGGIILSLAIMQLIRIWRPTWIGQIPHTPGFAWTLGIAAGMTTMLANAAGPVMALYFLAVGLPKLELVGTSAWFFLLLNLFKVPWSAQQGLITSQSLLCDLALIPAVILGLLAGRWLVKRVSQRFFDSLLLVFALVAAARLLWQSLYG